MVSYIKPINPRKPLNPSGRQTKGAKGLTSDWQFHEVSTVFRTVVSQRNGFKTAVSYVRLVSPFRTAFLDLFYDFYDILPETPPRYIPETVLKLTE